MCFSWNLWNLIKCKMKWFEANNFRFIVWVTRDRQKPRQEGNVIHELLLVKNSFDYMWLYAICGYMIYRTAATTTKLSKQDRNNERNKNPHANRYCVCLCVCARIRLRLMNRFAREKNPIRNALHSTRNTHTRSAHREHRFLLLHFILHTQFAATVNVSRWIYQ